MLIVRILWLLSMVIVLMIWYIPSLMMIVVILNGCSEWDSEVILINKSLSSLWLLFLWHWWQYVGIHPYASSPVFGCPAAPDDRLHRCPAALAVASLGGSHLRWTTSISGAFQICWFSSIKWFVPMDEIFFFFFLTLQERFNRFIMYAIIRVYIYIHTYV